MKTLVLVVLMCGYGGQVWSQHRDLPVRQPLARILSRRVLSTSPALMDNERPNHITPARLPGYAHLSKAHHNTKHRLTSTKVHTNAETGHTNAETGHTNAETGHTNTETSARTVQDHTRTVPMNKVAAPTRPTADVVVERNTTHVSSPPHSILQGPDHQPLCSPYSATSGSLIAPVALPGPRVCSLDQEIRDASNHTLSRGQIPPNVCDLCPTTENNANPLGICICIGNNGSIAGMISIMCPSAVTSLEELQAILTAPTYFTTNVFRFTLKGSTASGVLTKDVWGDLAMTQVVIEANKIQYVDNKAFNSSADTLEYLSLFDNEIAEYATMGQNDLPKLQHLILKRNNLTHIYSNYFNYTSLRTLDLSYNTINFIGSDSFAALDKLEELILSHNLLDKLGDGDFNFYNHRPATNFLDIDLGYNQIQSIHANAFPGLSNVRINLQHNQLTTISQAAFQHIIVASSYYAAFVFDGNPINCDCDIAWVLENSFVTNCFDNFICPNLGLPLWVLTPEDLGNCITRH